MASALAAGVMGVVVVLCAGLAALGDSVSASIRYQPQLLWISIVLAPAVSRTWPALTVVQVVVAGRDTWDPPALFRTTYVNLSPYGPL